MKNVKTAKDRIVDFLAEIDDVRQITEFGKPIRMSYEETKNKGFDKLFVSTFLKKLEQELKIIRVINIGSPCIGFFVLDGGGYSNPDEYYHVFELKVGFDDYYKRTIAEASSNKILPHSDNKNSGLKITYSEHAREIILNDFFVVSKPDFNSENEQVFYYLYRNPNRIIEKSEIEENFKSNQTLTKDFHKIVENLKFKKDLRKAFFDISQNSIKFFNPVSKERLQELGIKNIPIKVE